MIIVRAFVLLPARALVLCCFEQAHSGTIHKWVGCVDCTSMSVIPCGKCTCYALCYLLRDNAFPACDACRALRCVPCDVGSAWDM